MIFFFFFNWHPQVWLFQRLLWSLCTSGILMGQKPLVEVILSILRPVMWDLKIIKWDFYHFEQGFPPLWTRISTTLNKDFHLLCSWRNWGAKIHCFPNGAWWWLSQMREAALTESQCCPHRGVNIWNFWFSHQWICTSSECFQDVLSYEAG